MTHHIKHYIAILAVILLSGCATTGNHPQDPFEGFNRAMFQVHEGVDMVLLKPVAKAYDTVTPDLVQTGVTNFFSNISDVWIAVNNLLQGKGGDGMSDIGRVLVNSTIGIVGIFDVASEMGMEKHAEDFGQTLGKWGVDPGPYFYWPIIGPRTTRDTFGWAVDSYMDPLWYFEGVPTRNTLIGVHFIDMRASLLPTDKIIDEAAFDKYSYIRDAYLQNRISEINDGNVPIEGRDDSECKLSRCY